MKTQKKYHLIWKCLLFFLAVSCVDQEFSDNTRQKDADLIASNRSMLSTVLLDSTLRAEEQEKKKAGEKKNDVDKKTDGQIAAATLGTINYARQAYVTAESTYPGYAVSKIKDGSRTTTVGPSYSWANNFPAGNKLPQSVFLRFSSLKNIDRIDIYTSSGYEIQNYTIQYRITLNGAWTHLLSVTGNRSVYLSHSFAMRPMLEVRIICQYGPPNQTIYGRLNEVEIYGEAEPAAPYLWVENGRFAFSSVYDVEQAINYLEYKYDQYTDAFVAQYPGATDDQLDAYEESTGFDDNRPYLDFESAYGISSLRARVAYEESLWLENTTGEENAAYPDPDDTYAGDDDQERTLMNYWGEMKIGTDIYVFNPDGSYYQYYDDSGGGGCDLCVAQKMRTRKAGDPLPEGVKHVNAQTSAVVVGGCERVIKSTGFIYNSNRSWRMKWKVKAVDGPFGGRGHLKGVTKSYKKKNNGKWKVKGARIGAGAAGQLWDSSCSTPFNIEAYKGDKWKRKIKGINYYHGKVKENEVEGEFYHEKIGRFFKWLE